MTPMEKPQTELEHVFDKGIEEREEISAGKGRSTVCLTQCACTRKTWMGEIVGLPDVMQY